MAIFEYRAFNLQGKSIKGLIDADTVQDARLKLRRDNIYPFDLQFTSVSKRISKIELFNLFKQKIKTKEVALLTRQLGTLLKAGLPLMQALSTLIEQIDTPHVKKIFIEKLQSCKTH